MHDIIQISDYISSMKFSFFESEHYAIHCEWVYSTNKKFLQELSERFPGDINWCEEGGHYLVFKN